MQEYYFHEIKIIIMLDENLETFIDKIEYDVVTEPKEFYDFT